MYNIQPVAGLSEEARKLCREAMQGEFVIRKKARLIVNGTDYITNHDSEETRKTKWKAFRELEQAGVLSVKSVHPTSGTAEYRIEKALAKNIR